jgi:hypothetical protein
LGKGLDRSSNYKMDISRSKTSDGASPRLS